ncbi:phage holin, LLH family [Desemzia incerta]|uniref:phage holin, LLH family n=1 Tax=Desemzia incerta TaxID=82801 RepID=UPI003D0931FD
MEQVQAALFSALATIFVTLIAVITKKVVAFLDEKGITEKLSKKQYLVDIAVNAVEQIYQNENGAVKLANARKEAIKLLNDNGLDITESELQNLIEAAVKAMNDSINSTKVGVIELEEEK